MEGVPAAAGSTPARGGARAGGAARRLRRSAALQNGLVHGEAGISEFRTRVGAMNQKGAITDGADGRGSVDVPRASPPASPGGVPPPPAPGRLRSGRRFPGGRVWRREVSRRVLDDRFRDVCYGARMKCPACGNPLVSRGAGAITVDVCDGGCGGVWFDNFELRKVDEAGAHAIRSVPRDLSLLVDSQSRRRCPKCADQTMMRRFFSRLRRTQIDECPECAGIWLDAGEFDAIRKELDESPDTAVMNAALNHTVTLLRDRSGM